MKLFFVALVLYLSTFLQACKVDPADAVQTRSYRMGFQNSAPKNEFNLFIQSLQIWTQRADAAMITTEVPWDSLYSGVTAQQYVANNFMGAVNYYKQLNLKLYVFIDPANGLDRSADSQPLAALGKSISDPAVQQVYRRFVVVVDSMLHPDHLGLALETNLIRFSAPAALYNGVKSAANAAFADVRAFDAQVKIGISVQADLAWSKLSVTNDLNFVGVAQELTDFPFVEELGISSYPYFSFSSPSELPVNYYSKLVEGKSIPVFVSEGGWTSQTFTGPGGQTITGSTTVQQQYITRQSQMLDDAQATAVFQLTFTDLDISAIPPSVNPTIDYFAYLGLVDVNFQSKPALDTWDAIFKRPLK